MVEASKTLARHGFGGQWPEQPSLSELQGGGQPGAGQGLSSQPVSQINLGGQVLRFLNIRAPMDVEVNILRWRSSWRWPSWSWRARSWSLVSGCTGQGVPWWWRRTTSWGFSSWRREDWVEAFRVEERVGCMWVWYPSCSSWPPNWLTCFSPRLSTQISTGLKRVTAARKSFCLPAHFSPASEMQTKLGSSSPWAAPCASSEEV